MAETETTGAPPSSAGIEPARKSQKAPDSWFKTTQEALDFKEKAKEDVWTVMKLSCEHGPTVFALANPVHAPTVLARYARQYLGAKCEYAKKWNKVNELEAKIAELEAKNKELEGKGKKK